MIYGSLPSISSIKQTKNVSFIFLLHLVAMDNKTHQCHVLIKSTVLDLTFLLEEMVNLGGGNFQTSFPADSDFWGVFSDILVQRALKNTAPETP